MPTQLNPQIVQATQMVNETVSDWSVAQEQAVGMAFQVVAQASAAAVMDATDYLRNMNAVNIAAISTMTAKMVDEGGNAEQWAEAIREARKNSEAAATLFQTVGENAAKILQGFKV